MYNKKIVAALKYSTVSFVSSKTTNVLVVEIVFPSRLFTPAGDVNEVGHEARNLALEDGGVAKDDVFVIGLSEVRLSDNCTPQSPNHNSHITVAIQHNTNDNT